MSKAHRGRPRRPAHRRDGSAARLAPVPATGLPGPETPIRIRGPEDLLAVVPRVMGFHPEHSLVLVTVGDAPRPVHARVDLPSPGGPPDGPSDRPPSVPDGPDAPDLAAGAEALAEHLTTVAVRSGLSSVALVAYGEDALVAGVVVDALTSRLVDAGVDVVCALRADGSRWWWLDDVTGAGTPYDVALHPLMLAGVVDGTVVHADRGQLAASLVGTDPDEVARVAALAGARLDDLGLAATALRPVVVRPRSLLAGEARWLADRTQLFVADGERLDSADVARLAIAVTISLDLRDVAWCPMRRADAARHVDLWRDVVRRVPAELRAGPAAVLGFAAWLSGQGALAWCAVECCQRLDPGHSLARLLTDMLTGAVPPSTWHPQRVDLLPSS